MQVEGDVGIAGVAQQQAVQCFELRGRGWQLIKHLAHGLADQGDVGLGIAAQLLADTRRHRRTEFNKRAVEILAAAQLEAPHVTALQVLVEADRIGHRHQLDHALQTALLFQRVEALLEFPRGAHARQLVGVQAGLDVHLAAAGAVTENAEGTFAAKMAPRQDMVDALHGKTPEWLDHADPL